MKEEIQKALECIRKGGVLLYPTDTIWGLGCDPANDSAIQKICEIKSRDESKHFIVLVNSDLMLERYVEKVPEICYDLLDMAENPLTIVYPGGKNVSKKILAEDGSIAIRKTSNTFCSNLIQQLKHGLVSTSANLSGRPFSGKFADIDPSILEKVDYIVNLNQLDPVGKPSQIIKIGLKGELQIIRK
ncbi:MAG: threonylcarbamoyl-AMP synthase [Crocinitomicaceae bacterium]|nr:threonylcarbamoyl-AMP synthase [Crocinitomicaceae bacterium]